MGGPPGLLAAYATALEQSGALPQRGAFLGRAALHIADDPVARRWVRAEQIYDGAREGNLPIATIEREACELPTEVSPSEVWTHLRLLEALGKVLAQHDDPASLAEAQQRLRSAVSLAQAQQQPRVAIRVLQTLAYHLGVARGRYGVADDAFIEALAIAQRPSALRCRLIGYRADVLLAAGQVSRALAVLDEYDDVKALATARDAATVEWSRALALTTLGAVDDADHAAAQVYSSVLMQQYLGVWFMAELAMAQARVGRLAQAAATLAPALPRRDELPTYVGMAELAVRCRAEQLTEADLEQLRPVAAAVLAGEDLEARDRFRPHLFLAAALRTLGRADEARAEAITATTLAESVDASLLVRGEPDLARLLEMARDGGQRGGAEDDAASDSWEVSALGPLQIVRNGRLVAVPEGMPMRLVALLALHDDALPIERAAELLWPDSGTLGRRRLRNVLSRLRSAAGPLVVRVGSSLTLDKHADTDVRRLLRYAESAPSEAARLWRAAPLDDNPAYRDLWRVPAAAYLASVRRLAEAAEAVGDIDQAVRWISRGAEVAPEDASWLVHAARTQAAAGRLGSARATARRLARQVEGTPLRLPDDVARLATMRGR